MRFLCTQYCNIGSNYEPAEYLQALEERIQELEEHAVDKEEDIGPKAKRPRSKFFYKYNNPVFDESVLQQSQVLKAPKKL